MPVVHERTVIRRARTAGDRPRARRVAAEAIVGLVMLWFAICWYVRHPLAPAAQVLASHRLTQ